jgi:hypothetical protein
MNSWAYLQAFNADHDDIHFFTLTLGNFLESYFMFQLIYIKGFVFS